MRKPSWATVATALAAILWLSGCQESGNATRTVTPAVVKAPALPAIDAKLLQAAAIEHPLAAPFLGSAGTAKVIATLKDAKQAEQVAFTPDGKYLVCLDYSGGALRVWDWREGKVAAALENQRLPVSFAIEPGGLGLWGGDSYGSLRRWPMEADGGFGQPASIGEDLGNMMHVAFSPNGRIAACVSFGKTLALWDAQARAQLARITTDEPLRYCAFSPDGMRLVVGTNTNQLLEYQLATGEGRKVHILPVKPDIDLMCMAFSPDGKRFSTGHTQPWATVWEGDSLLYKHWLACPEHAICAIAYTRDSTLIALGLGDMNIHFWKPDIPKEEGSVAVLKGHTKSINTLAFSPEGRILASGDDGGTILLWQGE